jgi:amino acid transporter
VNRTIGAGRGQREPTIPYQLSRRTSRDPARVLSDIAALEVPGIVVVARGSTHLVLAPGRPARYGAGWAVTLGVLITLAVLIASAASVPLIALLPAALLPGVPLLLRREPRLAVGVLDDPEQGDTVVTVGGDMWSALAVALHSYLSGLPSSRTVDAGPTPPAPVTASAENPVRPAAAGDRDPAPQPSSDESAAS